VWEETFLQRIFITPPKTQYHRKIKDEIGRLRINVIEMLLGRMVIGI